MLFVTVFIARPYPVTITSDTIGQDPYDYKLYWEKPRTGGIPIREYRFRYRRVSALEESTVCFYQVTVKRIVMLISAYSKGYT